MANVRVRFKTKVKGGKPEADGKTFVLDAEKAKAYIDRGIAVEIPWSDEEKKAMAEAEKKAAEAEAAKGKAEADRQAKEEAEKAKAAAEAAKRTPAGGQTT